MGCTLSIVGGRVDGFGSYLWRVNKNILRARRDVKGFIVREVKTIGRGGGKILDMLFGD